MIFCIHEKIALDVYKWVMNTVFPTKNEPELLQCKLLLVEKVNYLTITFYKYFLTYSA